MIRQLFLFEFLDIIYLLLIIDQLVRINQSSIHWSWNFYLGVLENCLWAVFKPDIQIFFSRRFVEYYHEVAVWSFRLVHIN